MTHFIDKFIACTLTADSHGLVLLVTVWGKSNKVSITMTLFGSHMVVAVNGLRFSFLHLPHDLL